MVFDLSLRSIRDGKTTTIREFSRLTLEQSSRLAIALKTNTTLTHLDLKNADFSDEGIEHLADALKTNNTLTKLRLISTQIGDRGACYLGEALAENQTLLNLLLLVGNGIGNEGVGQIAKGLMANSTLVTLALSHTRTGDLGALHLSHLLRQNKTLQKLGLSHTLVGDKGAMHLSKALKMNVTVLESLFLRNTKIGDAGAKHLGDALKVNKYLVKLYLSYTNIGDIGAGHLADGLCHNQSLDMLFLNNTKIADKGAMHIANALTRNKTLVILNLANTLVGDEGATYLASGLRFNQALVRLSLNDTKVSNVGARHLVDSLKVNQSLTKLFLSLKQIGVEEMRECQKSLERNKMIKQKRFLDTLNSDEKAPWNRSRVMFVGRGKAGKTATVRSLIGQPFTEEWDSTIGATLLESKQSVLEGRNWFKVKQPKTKQQLKYSARHAAIIMVNASSKLKPAKGNIFSRLFGNKRSSRKRAPRIPISIDVRCNSNTNQAIIEDIDYQRDDFMMPFHDLPNRQEIHSYQGSESSANSDETEGQKVIQLISDVVETEAGYCESLGDTQKEQIITPDQTTENENGQILANTQNGSQHDIKEKFYERLLVEARHESETLNLTLWDFGGQEVFYSMHQLFLTNTGVYVLVFDATEITSEDKRPNALHYLSFWLNSVRLHSPKSPLLLVATRINDIPDFKSLLVVENSIASLIGDNFKHVVMNPVENFSFFPIDNKTGRGIEQLRSILGEETRNECSSRQVSIRWLALLDEMIFNDEKRPYIELSDVKAIGNRIGIKQSAEQESALGLFHEFGLICHLTMTETLRNVVIINPQWLLDSLSKVIRDLTLHKFNQNEIERFGLTEDLEQSYEKAIVSRDVLEYVWEKNQVDFLIDVMKHTMLMIDWNFSNDKCYLVPSLLKDDDELKSEDLRDDGICFIFDFSPSFLPRGLFQRLICLSVAHYSLHESTTDLAEPVLSKNTGTIQFTDNCTIHLCQHESDACLSVYVDNKDYAAEMLSYIRTMMSRLNYHLMNGGLSWETFLEDVETGDMVSYDYIIRHKIDPWYIQIENNRKTIEVDMDSFLDSVIS